MRTLVWFRRDLRLRDHPALFHAAHQGEVVAVYLKCPKQWALHDESPAKVDFWLRCLGKLSENLADRNIPLLIAEVELFTDAPAALLDLARKHQCDALHFNAEYEVNERQRDEAVTTAFQQAALSVRSFTDRVLLAPGEVLTQQDKFYSVFTPFKRAWIKQAEAAGELHVLPMPRKQPMIDVKPSRLKDWSVASEPPPIDAEQWPAGEDFALRQLKRFITNAADDYAASRDFPAINGTSRLSPYLAAGVLSPRQCLHRALMANNGRYEGGNTGIATWVSELIWREFYQHILVGYPRVSRHRPFRLETQRVQWNNNDAHFAAWCEGRTGFPIVDAGMRQLLHTGWMHNRVRMVTAMFLSKQLLLDWRRGERFFMQHLIDGDLASNNGGWQWSASTGTDAAPYFRVFNPTAQSERYDPQGRYIRTWVHELAEVDAKAIHAPPPLLREQTGYPQPIVDHVKARKAAIDAFERLR